MFSNVFVADLETNVDLQYLKEDNKKVENQLFIWVDRDRTRAYTIKYSSFVLVRCFRAHQMNAFILLSSHKILCCSQLFFSFIFLWAIRILFIYLSFPIVILPFRSLKYLQPQWPYFALSFSMSELFSLLHPNCIAFENSLSGTLVQH